ncbi:MAG: gliding motility-associated C-terminal domain-containing protein [Saprospiraceae bacterium]
MVRFQSILCVIFLLVNCSLQGQTPFTCEGQVWMIGESDNTLYQLSVGSNNGIVFTSINDNLGIEINAIGYRITDQMLYGLNPLTHELYRIDANGNVEILGTPNVDVSLAYFAGDVTPDGNSLVVIGSNNGDDTKLLTIDLTSGNYEVVEIDFSNGTRTNDISFHPITSVMFGFDDIGKRFYTHNLGSNSINAMPPIFFEHDVKGMYFDAFGNMYGYGNAVLGLVSGLFEVDQSTGETRLISTSGVLPITDMAGCPFSIEIDNKVIPEIMLPCSDLSFEFAFANQTGGIIENVLLEHELPNGFTFISPTNIPFGGTLDNTTADNFLRIENLSIPQGIHTYTVQAYVDDIPKAFYKSQATLSNIPTENGSIVLSNNPSSAATEDSTRMEVNRFDEDSLTFNSFLCLGNSVTLDASEYGNNITWNNGSTAQQINVFQTGLFSLSAGSACENIIVNYDVVSATCPYTIELRHIVQPDTLFGCSEALFRYILENDSGEERFDLTLLDTLPTGFTFLEIVNNPYDSELTPNLPPNVFQLENILLHEGIDTIDILVSVEDVIPGINRNKALLKGLPQGIGQTRTSDDPSTTFFPDSTSFFIKGVGDDFLTIDTFICEDGNVLLDASLFGKTFLWYDGSTNSQIEVEEMGDYPVLILDGCDTATVIFNVEEGDHINVEFDVASYSIQQSESIELEPFIINAGDSLAILWNDPAPNSLNCINCPQPIATPLNDIIYAVYVNNGFCADSTLIEILVDETRRVYIPNAFSPNGDGYNDSFFFQSPDPATITSFKVFNRWGSLVFETKEAMLNSAQGGWDGMVNGKIVQSGVYIWLAEFEFFDEKKETLHGDVTVTN